MRCCKSPPGCTSGWAFRCETLHGASVYTNGTRIDREPVELSIASLRFSIGIASFAPVAVEVWDRLEAERPDSRSEFMVATSGDELLADVATVLAFVSTLRGPPTGTWYAGWCRKRCLIVRMVGRRASFGGQSTHNEVDPGDGAVERVGYPHGTGATATPAAPRPTPIGKRASLRARCWTIGCWMDYRWSKKVRTSALKRAGCSMFDA